MIIDLIEIEAICHERDLMFELSLFEGKWYAEFQNRTYRGEPDVWGSKSDGPMQAVQYAIEKLNK